MKWIKVEESLPTEDKEVFIAIGGYFSNSINPLFQKINIKICYGSFNHKHGWRKHGWHMSYESQNISNVISWAEKPIDTYYGKD